MKVHVQLFSLLRECLPGDAERGKAIVELQENSSVMGLFEHLGIDRCLGGTRLVEQLESWQISVNGEFIQDLNLALKDGDLVIVFPHMAGGRESDEGIHFFT